MTTAGSPLPLPRGPLSESVLGVLGGNRQPNRLGEHSEVDDPGIDPYGEDLQLSLYVCYELHYRSFEGVEDTLEWDPDLLRFRAALERCFLAALRSDVAGGADVEAELSALLEEPSTGTGPSWHLLERGRPEELREYVVHRSIYHLKEADPQAWVIPRLDGQAKASMVAVEHDEYGAGRGDRQHARLFAEMMAELGLDPGYGHYLDSVPAVTLATVNAMSLFGLHRRWRGALVGQFANVEITSSPGSARLAAAVERLAGVKASAFYIEHVEADAVHEQLVRHGIVGPLLAEEPELAADVVFGVRVSTLLDERFGAHLLGCWSSGQSSLRHPLPEGRERWLVSQNG